MPVIVALAVCAIVIALVYFHRSRKRQAALLIPFSPDWIDILERNLPPYGRFSDEVREQLHDLIKVFLYDKNFEGCNGVEIDDEKRVTIAAQACMLLLKRQTKCYPRLKSVLVYPSTYIDQETNVARLGESWHSGVVVLAWNSVKGGVMNFEDGQNVTMHEFAHQLDQEDGAADGAPILGKLSAYSAWGRVFSKEYEELKERHGRKHVMDSYGATNPAEFFAVATETFYEKPEQLKRKHPELFDELLEFYKVNPLEWI